MRKLIMEKAGTHPALVLIAAWVAWLIVDWLDVFVAYSNNQYSAILSVVGFGAPSITKWVVGSLGVGWAILDRAREDGEGRLRSITALLAGLVVSRVISLVPGVGSVLPPLTILWTPHLSWAVSVSVLVWVSFPSLRVLLARRDRTTGLAILVVFCVVYGLYGLFFVRTTILHGDEPQFLMIAQSLVRDGDMDLSNTAPADHLEYHQFQHVSIHKAPGSPAGKVHNTHPVGPALLLAPSYWLGDLLLDHPRLTSALTIALTAACVLLLLFHLLRRLDFDPVTSTLVCVVGGTSPLLFMYSNQIYPDVPAVLLTVPALIAASRTGASRFAIVSSFGLALLLPIVHPRLLPLTGLLAVGLWLRVRDRDDARVTLKWCGALAGAALISYVSYHLHYTGDIWGPYKPGNAWKAHTPSIGGLLQAISGQWLDLHVGLLVNAPVYGLAIPGFVMLFRSGRRDLGIAAIALYAVTAGVNATSDDWRFGYCYASRFMITALPALAIPLAVVLERCLKRDPGLLVLFAFGAAIGLDTILETLRAPEAAYLGQHLTDRAISGQYPIGVHFADLLRSTSVPFADALIWGLIAALPFLIPQSVRYRTGAAVMAGVVVLSVVGGFAYEDRFSTQVSARLPIVSDQGVGLPSVVNRTKAIGPQRGADTQGGGIVVTDGTVSAGVVGYSSFPHLIPSVYGVVFPYQWEGAEAGVTGGYSILAERPSVRAYGNHEVRHAIPMRGTEGIAAHRFVREDGKHLMYHFVSYGGKGTIATGEARVAMNVAPTREIRTEAFRSETDLPREGERGFTVSFGLGNLSPGFYRMILDVSDVDPSVWVRRRNDPIMFAVFSGDIEEGRSKAKGWMPMLGRTMEYVPPVGVERPMVEAYLAPHWAMVPMVRDREMAFAFENDRQQSVYVIGVYTGEVSLRLNGIRMEGRSFEVRENGRWVPLNLPPRTADVSE